ncbi:MULTISPECIES: hypothetical protein [unclassified Tenacibaculum]|uniref:hypothetical protein n=1 Tax=unclassified Tenacibaculum TaxID=2635139 RepID=UPI001F433EA7|nr:MULTISPECIES: hypothetical protein [unclassified Tenacibaculum]MCF2874041.1 hypothetical protein [Tenacibaculum sp. Cn5-1]MCF2934622.1 hypothetical protein [Tenacibaculum sp. Cn5-34]MCG7510832.1 hypothetical protein [Tenacibaculum sp. Cn5-46]
MNLDSIKNETAKQLEVDTAELDYITDELILDFFNDSKTEEITDEGPEGEEIKGRWGVYGNSITYSQHKVHYKRNDKGTPNYGCGTDNWSVGKKHARYIIQNETCSGGRKMYFIGNYRP